jgi:hypothetical protein
MLVADLDVWLTAVTFAEPNKATLASRGAPDVNLRPTRQSCTHWEIAIVG